MNEQVRSPLDGASVASPLAPQRRRFTAGDLEAMDRSGILGPQERVELIDGEIIIMAAKGPRHEIMRTRLTKFWSRRSPEDLMVASEPALHLEPHNEPEPDIVVFQDVLQAPQVRGDTVLLVVEIADSSLSYDLTVKAALYSRFGVREYWVIDPKACETHIHRDPRGQVYGSVSVASRADLLTPLLAPTLAVRLGDLRLDWDGEG